MHAQQTTCSRNVGTGVDEPTTRADTMMPLHVGDGAQKFSWPVSDPSVHPKYSIENKIDSSLTEYESILKSALPEHLKAKLLSHYRTKYLINRQHAHDADVGDGDDDEDDSEDEDDNDSEDAKKYMELGVHKVLADIPSTVKRGAAKHILDVMLRHRDLITWNRHGVLVKPKNSPVTKLKQLITNLTYANRGAVDVNRAIADLIKPIFREIEHQVINKKILDYIYPAHTRSPYKSPQKKKKRNKARYVAI